MSRSYKQPIIKDRPRNQKKSSQYWRKIRSRWNTELKSNDIENLDLDFCFTAPQTLINDYDYSDYKYKVDNITFSGKVLRPRYFNRKNKINK